MQERFHSFNLNQDMYKEARVSYFKLRKISWNSLKSDGDVVFLSVGRTTFILFISLARTNRYVLHFSLNLPFLPRTTGVDVLVFLLPIVPPFCSSPLLPTDYALVVNASSSLRFSSHLLSFSFSFLWSRSKYVLSLLQQFSISVLLQEGKLACSYLPSFSMQLNSIRFTLSLFHSCSVPYKLFSISFHSFRILLLSVIRFQNFNSIFLNKFWNWYLIIYCIFNICC